MTTLTILNPIRDYNSLIVPGGDFSWHEYSYLPQWHVHAIPTEGQFKNAINLVEHFQPIRKELGKGIIITSGARTLAYTQYLNAHGTRAAWHSAHMDWAAMDIICPGMSVLELWKFIRPRWAGRMEHPAITTGWVHIDTRDWGAKITFKP